MAVYRCLICGYEHDDGQGEPWQDLPDDWVCPICGAGKDDFERLGDDEPASAPAPGGGGTAGEPASTGLESYLAEWTRAGDDREPHMADIHAMAKTGESISEPMRSAPAANAAAGVPGWEDLLFEGAQLARLPLNEDEPVGTRTVIGPRAAAPLVVETPVIVSHMSFGALSREVKIALATGSAAAGSAICSGEGGILDESLAAADRYIFEYVPNRYSVTDEYLARVDAVELKIGQSAKPGVGGHLPAGKVTAEIAAVRARPKGVAITSPARFPDIESADDLRRTVQWLREKTGGKPVGIKLAAGDVEGDLAVALAAGPDFITIDGRPGATGSAPKFVKAATSVPTLYALRRARRFLDAHGATDVSLIITGGLRISPDIAKALALGADAVALATASLMAAGCQQYRICQTGRCPVGITSHDPELTSRLDIDASAQRVANFLRATTGELRMFARLTGHGDVHDLSPADLCTTNTELSDHLDVKHAGRGGATVGTTARSAGEEPSGVNGPGKETDMGTTQDNLADAFAGESQANRRYLAFAKKADADGYPQVARLFRAAAAAETVHAHAHLRVMGGIRATAENLAEAIKGEAFEFHTMYPEYLRKAEEEGNKPATVSFRNALAVEEVHHALYAGAAEAVSAEKDLEAAPIHVCDVCGNTFVGDVPDRCPVCGVPSSRFFEVE